MSKAWSSSLGFIHSVSFEISVCFSTAVGIVPLWDDMTDDDHASIVCQFIFLCTLVAYLGFIFHFVAFKSKELAVLYQG